MTDIGDMIERGSDGPEWEQCRSYETESLRQECWRWIERATKAETELAALRAEVERLLEELLKIKFAVAVYDDSSDRWRSDFDASCAGGTLADAVRAVCDEFLSAPPAKEE